MPFPPPTDPAAPLPVAGITRAQARVIWSALALLVAAAPVAAAIAARLVPGGAAEADPVLLVVAAVMVAADLVMAHVVTGRMRRGASGRAPADAGVQTIVASACAVGAALVACVFFFVTRERLLLGLVAPCAAVLAHWFPSESRWSALQGEPATNRLVRG